MSVLAGIIRPDKHINSIREAADALVAECRRLERTPTWSICELNLSDADFHWLEDWVSLLREDQLALTLRQDSRLPVVGLLLLAYTAETCRRDGRERGIYEVFADGPFQDDVRSVLLTTLQYPRKQVQVALEQACRIFGLRHAFDSPTTQPWYLTTKLQFGFTLQGASDRLEHWLCGVPPDAIEWLVQGESQSNHAGTPIRSQSFARLWDALGRFRANQISTADARQAIIDSPWTLAQWADPLLEAAGRPIAGAEYVYVPAADREPTDRTVAEQERQLEADDEPRICSAPRVLWNDGEVSVVVGFDERFLSQLNGECFFVSIDEKACDVLRRQPDRSLSNNAGDMALAISGERDEVLVSVSDAQGKSIASETIEVFDRGEDFQAYGQHGARVSTRRLSQQSGYTLRLPAGTLFAPNDDFASRVLGGGAMWVQLKPGWSDDATVRLPGDTFDLLLRSDHQYAVNDWAELVCKQPITHETDSFRFHVSFSAPADVSIRDVKICGETVSFERTTSGGYRTAMLSTSELRHDGRGTLRIVAEKHNCRVIHREFNARREGLILFQEGVWKSRRRDQLLDSTRLSRTQVVVRPGETHRDEGWALREGATKITFRAKRPHRLSSLGCRGWPLTVIDHLYNRTAGSKSMTLCDSVVDQGIVQAGVQRPGSRLVALDLLDALERSDDHHVVLWTKSGRIANIASGRVHVTRNQWSVDPADAGIEYDDPVVAAALAFRGTRLGSWWTNEWWRVATRIRDQSAAMELAACLRWFCLPLMQQARLLRSVASAYGDAFFRQWCFPLKIAPNSQTEFRKTDQFLSSDLLRQNDDEPNWFPTVRSLLSDWQPTAQGARSIAPQVWQERDGKTEQAADSIEYIVSALAMSMPIVVARILRAWFSSEDDIAAERNLRRFLACELCKDLDKRAVSELEAMRKRGFVPDGRHESLLWLPLNKHFVDSLIETAAKLVDGESVADLDADNLESAFNFSELCRVVAARLIEPVTKPCTELATS